MVNTIFRNLLSNAIKFTPEGGTVSVNATTTNDRLMLSIEDTGLGMSPEDLKKLFKLDEFHSTNGTDGEAGTGLGLIVCRDFVKRHGGDLNVESLPGKGSRFTFDLPVSKSEKLNTAS